MDHRFILEKLDEELILHNFWY